MSNKTAVYRNTVACSNTEAGVAHTEVRVHQGWEHSTSTDIYLRGSFNAHGMIVGSGKWDALDKYYCWWESSGAAIPRQLLDLVFPNLDTVGQLASQLAANPRTAGDLSAVAVCDVLKHARKVFLEDAVVKRPKYPAFPAYSHPVFSHPLWGPYAKEEAFRVEVKKQNWLEKDAELGDRVDGLQGTVENMTGTLSKQLQQLEGKIEQLAVAGASAAAMAAPAEASTSTSGSGSVNRVPVLPPKIAGVRIFYREWGLLLQPQYLRYKEINGEYKWIEMFGKDKAHSEKQSYFKVSPWLAFMDSFTVGVEVQQGVVLVDTALGVFERVSVELGVSEDTLVRALFPLLVKPHTKCAHPKSRACNCSEKVAKLKAAIEEAGFGEALAAVTKKPKVV
jgi:hypothetical protein